AGAIAGVLILMGILIAFNAVLSPIRLRKDVTEDKLYTLSDGTKEVLKSLDRDVTLKFYFSKSNERLPIPLKNFAGRVRDLLAEYESRAGSHLVIEEFDPKPDSDEEEWAQRYGLQGQALDMFGTGGDLYFGIVAISGKREANIPVLAPGIEPQLEYTLTRMISEVSRDKASKVGLMSSMPILGDTVSFADGRQTGWGTMLELSRQTNVESVDMSVDAIPADIDTLLVVHPAGMSGNTLYAIDQFVLRGGRLLAFMDPLCISAKDSVPAMMRQYGIRPPPEDSDLNSLTKAWGVQMTDRFAADEAAATPLNMGEGRAQRNAAWLSLRPKNINREEVATSSLGDMMLPFAGTFEGKPAEGLQMTELLYTDADGFLTDAQSVIDGNIKVPSLKKKQLMAVRLQGTFKTAFPNGKPVDETVTNQTVSVEKGLQESTKPGVVILVSDVDMLGDSFALQSMELFGQTIQQPRNDNLAFVLNLTEQISGSQSLIGLRSRGSFDRPFERVVALEKKAQLKWKAEEDRLNEKLQAAQARVSALQQVRSDGQQQIMTAEQNAEIKKFREEAFQTQQSLKEVRKNLRKDIETLGMRLKVINIAGVPLLVALFGITRGLWLKKTR
ncbi:MAG: GldG family protein, partial [Pontiellaceae bacterium]|nr:GldG family protein [Pontiellaceae bacterium]